MMHTTSTPTLPPSVGGHTHSGMRLVVLLCFLLFFFSTSAQAQPPRKFLLGQPAAELVDGTLTLHLSLTVDDEDGLRDLLKDGALLELRITVAVERERSWWSNAEALSTAFSSWIKHDPLSRDFLVTVPGPDGEREFRDRNLTRLLHASWKKLTLPVAQMDVIQDTEEADAYIIHLTITLQHAEVPPWLEKAFVFWSKNVVPEETRSMFFSVPGR